MEPPCGDSAGAGATATAAVLDHDEGKRALSESDAGTTVA